MVDCSVLVMQDLRARRQAVRLARASSEKDQENVVCPIVMANRKLKRKRRATRQQKKEMSVGEGGEKGGMGAVTAQARGWTGEEESACERKRIRLRIWTYLGASNDGGLDSGDVVQPVGRKGVGDQRGPSE